MGTGSEEFLIRLAERSRVLLLGGLAVIAHGLSRTTEDAGVWLDSSTTLQEWEKILRECLPEGKGVYFWDLQKREQVSAADFGAVVKDLGVVRIGGMDRYVDIFRRPNELHEEDFDAVWEAAKPHLHATCEAALKNPDAVVREFGMA